MTAFFTALFCINFQNQNEIGVKYFLGKVEIIRFMKHLRILIFVFVGAFFSVQARDSLPFWKSSTFEKERLTDGKMRLFTQIDVLGKPKIVEVIYTADVEPFAESILQNSIRIIPVIASYLQIAPNREKYTITHLADKSTARNEGHTVLVPFNYPDPQKPLPVPLLFHEIDHWWFGQNPRFISEGVSSFLPIALAKAGALNLTKDEILEIQNWWGFYVPKVLKDRPLGDEDLKIPNEDENFSLFYQKTFKIQYIIYNELGAEGYLKFLKSLKNYDSTEEHFIHSAEDAQSTAGVLSLLSDVHKKNWKKILSGWIESKVYSGVSIAEWQDTDLDGLLDVEERYLGTNVKNKDTDEDGLTDGAEVSLETNPLIRESASTFEEKISETGPILDGSDSDWKFLKSKKVVTTTPNSKIPGMFDMIEFSYFWKEDTLYGMIKTKEPPRFNPANKGIYYFLMDSSTNPVTEGFGFWYANDAHIGWEIRKNNPPEQVYGRVGDVFEFKIKIPKDDPRPKKYIPLIRKTENYGIWNNYNPIEIER